MKFVLENRQFGILIGDMSYWNGTTTIYENLDYTNWGATHGRAGITSQVASIPAANQPAYTDGYNMGVYWRYNVRRMQL